MSTTPNVPYRLEFSVEVPGTPEQVWQAIATAKGMSAWFAADRDGGARGRLPALHHGPRDGLGRPGHRLGPAAPHRLRGGLGRPHGQGPGCAQPADVGVPRRGAVRRHLRRARHQQRLRDRRRLGVGVLGRHGPELDAVLRQPAPLPVALPRPGGHARWRPPPPTPATRRRSGRPCTTRSGWATRARRSRCAAPPARSSASASGRRWSGSPRRCPGCSASSRTDEGDGKATAGVRAYLFSADAADYVRREEPAWQAWLQGLSVPA